MSQEHPMDGFRFLSLEEVFLSDEFGKDRNSGTSPAGPVVPPATPVAAGHTHRRRRTAVAVMSVGTAALAVGLVIALGPGGNAGRPNPVASPVIAPPSAPVRAGATARPNPVGDQGPTVAAAGGPASAWSIRLAGLAGSAGGLTPVTATAPVPPPMTTTTESNGAAEIGSIPSAGPSPSGPTDTSPPTTAQAPAPAPAPVPSGDPLAPVTSLVTPVVTPVVSPVVTPVVTPVLSTVAATIPAAAPVVAVLTSFVAPLTATGISLGSGL